MADHAREPFDLQCHSLHSDGTLPPAEVVARAAGTGVRLLALTDHDTVAGVPEAVAAGERHGVRVVPAIELSAVDEHSGGDLHILGYRIDHTDIALAGWLTEFRVDREQRALAMAEGLREQGLQLDDRPLAALAATGASVGRPHLATAVLDHPANSTRLQAEGIADIGDMIRGYLTTGRPAYRPRNFPTVEQAFAIIHAAGGVAVWAHPFRNVSDSEQALATIDRLHRGGLDGVEAFYITHTHPQTKLLAERCAELGLLSTGSADFHGPHNRNSRFLAFETYDLEPNLGVIAA
jgi:predicted metal-dependent phosphoesterase TrpH